MEIKYWAVNYMLSWLCTEEKKERNERIKCSIVTIKFGLGLTQP